jgi:hypothetical protein
MRDSNELNQVRAMRVYTVDNTKEKKIRNSFSLRLSVVLLQRKGSVESLITKFRLVFDKIDKISIDNRYHR